jgi:hypothetical protein
MHSRSGLLVAAGLAAAAAIASCPASAASQTAEVEPAALELVKTMSDTLSSAKALSFDVRGAFDVPAGNGQPLFYYTLSHVTLERPDKLKVVTDGDAAPEEFTYDGSEMAVYMPKSNMVARGKIAGDLDNVLHRAYGAAGLYFPFVDVIVSDPYKSLTADALSAFVIGKSKLVGGVTTDIVAIADGRMQWQIWIGEDDHLPRLIWSTPTGMPEKPRIMEEFSNWKLGDEVSSETYSSRAPADAARIEFARPTAR